MRHLFIAVAAIAVLPHLAHAQVPSGTAVKFGPGPDFLPKAVEFALIQGDPSKPGVYTVRLRFPNNFQFAAHWHPTDEHVTVLQGTFLVGMGDSIDVAKALTLTAGGFITAPANGHHYAVTRGVTVVQVSGEGPFALTYVKASDDPRQAHTTP